MLEISGARRSPPPRSAYGNDYTASIPPKGGHFVDAGGGKQHWEVVAKGNELVLYVLDPNEKPVNVDGNGAKGQVLLAGKTYNVDFKPAGGNTLKASGDFTAA